MDRLLLRAGQPGRELVAEGRPWEALPPSFPVGKVEGLPFHWVPRTWMVVDLRTWAVVLPWVLPWAVVPWAVVPWRERRRSHRTHSS